MVLEILKHTPLWVYGLLLGLLYLGVTQSRPRQLSRTRALMLPMVMVVLSALGLISSFGATALHLGLWLAGLAVTALVAGELFTLVKARYHAHSGQFHVEGSWLPLLLILGIFLTKYLVGVLSALHSPLLAEPAVVAILCLFYGVLSGLFLARARRLWRLARQPE